MRNTILYAILVSAIICVLELVSYFTVSYFFNNRGLIYNPVLPSQEAYEDYRANRDIALGWLPGRSQKAELDPSGSRIIPSYPNPSLSKPCISIYGDSYTWSNRTTPEEAWSNRLSILGGCRVSNYGVSGYGSDQAYLRFLNNNNDSARTVILNHFVFDIFRNVNQHTGTRNPNENSVFLFKPRYIIDKDGKLELIDLVDIQPENMVDFQANPSKYLKHEYFLPDGHYGSQVFSFPYTWVLVKTILFHTKFRSLFKAEPTHAPFYQPGHPSRALEITAKIMEAFDNVAKAQKRNPIVTIIPYFSDFTYFEKEGAWCFQPLLDILEGKGVRCINIGEEMLGKLNGRSTVTYYAGEGHFNAKGDQLISEIIYSYLIKQDLLD